LPQAAEKKMGRSKTPILFMSNRIVSGSNITTAVREHSS
jgi:hypothetical protein